MTTRTTWGLPSGGTTAIALGGLISILTMITVVESNYGYRLGISNITPLVRFTVTAAIFGLLLYKCFPIRQLSLDYLSSLIMFYIFVGSVIGLYYNGPSYEYFRHFFASFTILVCYLCGRTYSSSILSASGTITAVGWATILATAVVTVCVIPAMDAPAFSLSPGVALLALDAGLHGGGWWMAGLALFFVAIGNKRAVLLGAALMLAIHLSRRMRTSWRLIAIPAAAAVFTLAASLLLSQVGTTLHSLGISTSLFDRAGRIVSSFERQEAWQPTLPNSQPQTEPNPPTNTWLERFSSARVSMAEGVIESVNGSWLTLIFGRGFGASYDWRYWSDNLHAWQESTLYQVDIAPLWFLLTGGLLFAVGLTGLIGWAVFQVFLGTMTGTWPIGALFVVGMSLDMLLSFQPNLVIFWLLLGALRRGAPA